MEQGQASGAGYSDQIPLLTATAAAILLSLLLLHRFFFNKQVLPPGPRGIPIFGYMLKMPQLLRSPMNFQALAQKYEPIMTLQVGVMPLIVVSSSALSHEALIEKGAVFSARPQILSQRQLVLSNNRRSINTSGGNHWRTMRRNLVSHVLNPLRVQAFDQVRERAVRELIEKIQQESKSGAPLHVLATMRYAVFSILAYMCFGTWLGEESINSLESMLRQIFTTIRAGNLSDFIPILKIFKLYSRDHQVLELKQNREKMLLPLVQRSMDLAAEGKIDTNSYLSSLFQLQEQHRELDLTTEDFVTLCSEFLNAGADTTANILEWSIANLIKYPAIQEKLYEEIESVVGSRPVSEKDIDKLHYLRAVVKETLRRHPPGYTTLPHAVTRPCKLAGYDIPTNATILFNIYSVNHDPKLWKNPNEFQPERFVGDSAVQADLNASSGQLNLVTFGAGRRICPGLALATLHIHLLLARAVQEFEWKTAVPGEVVDLTPKQEFTVVMKSPLNATVAARKIRNEGSL